MEATEQNNDCYELAASWWIWSLPARQEKQLIVLLNYLLVAKYLATRIFAMGHMHPQEYLIQYETLLLILLSYI